MTQIHFEKAANTACRENNKEKSKSGTDEVEGGNVEAFKKNDPSTNFDLFEDTVSEFNYAPNHLVPYLVLDYFCKAMENAKEGEQVEEKAKLHPVMQESTQKFGISMIGGHPKKGVVIQCLWLQQGGNKME